MAQNEIIKILVISFLLRIIPILVLDYFQDIKSGSIAFTDIDYKVYSDSTLYGSPYERHTYRYTPLLSYLMIFNYSIAQSIGKIIFTFFDLGAIYFLWKIAFGNGNMGIQQKKMDEKMQNANLIAKLYGYNPLFIYLTARGSCESIALFLMYGFWYHMFTEQKYGNMSPQQFKEHKIKQFQVSTSKRICGYLLFGLWVHFRVYPIILLPLILIYQYRSCVQQTKAKFIQKFIKMGLFSGGVFVLLLVVFFFLYGEQFLNESYLYHFFRKDNRHSFSPFFYQIYLNYDYAGMGRSLIRNLPSIYMVIVLTFTYSKRYSIYYMHFLITFGFVEFNKVITLQYYMWVWGALFLVLPESRILTMKQYRKGINLTLQWVLAVSLWIWLSLRLQNTGQDVFQIMWIVCLGKIFLDVWVLSGFMQTIKKMTAQQQKRINLQEAKNILMGKDKKNN